MAPWERHISFADADAYVRIARKGLRVIEINIRVTSWAVLGTLRSRLDGLEASCMRSGALINKNSAPLVRLTLLAESLIDPGGKTFFE